MDRREMFTAAFSSLLAAPGGAATFPAAAGFDPTVAPRDANGRAVCRIYRQDAAGAWREVLPADVKAGNRIICVGLDGRRLWMVRLIDVAEARPPEDGDGGSVVLDSTGKFVNLLTLEGCE
jgi:hypothetical protein